MKSPLSFLAAFFAVLCIGILHADEKYVPEEGSAELEPKKKRGKKVPINPDLPYVLIIGDSISVGYTPTAREELEGIANVLHNPGNAQGTTNGLANLEAWITAEDWDVIHFNFGLHDLKRVTVAGTANNSNDPNDPYQADLPTYTANLKQIVARLKETEAELIFATTTPFPSGVKPYRSPEDAANYNEAALEIMEENGIEVNDLYSLVLPQLETLQKPVNVHFRTEGSVLMGKQVAARMKAVLDE